MVQMTAWQMFEFKKATWGCLGSPKIVISNKIWKKMMVFLHCVLICSNMKLNLLAKMSLKTARHMWANTKKHFGTAQGVPGGAWGCTKGLPVPSRAHDWISWIQYVKEGLFFLFIPKNTTMLMNWGTPPDTPWAVPKCFYCLATYVWQTLGPFESVD